MKKYWLSIVLFIFGRLLSFPSLLAFSNVPTFDSVFANKLKEWSERVYKPLALWIDSKKSLKENIRLMFYPDAQTSDGGRIRSILRILAAWLFVGMIMYTGIMFIWRPDDPKRIENARMNLLYVVYGGFLIFWSAYLVWLLHFETTLWSKELVQNLQTGILVNIIAFMKWIAFFFAIVMIGWYWFSIMRALGEEEKRKAGITWVINVLLALVFIKLLDFVYYIAQQQDFRSRFSSLFVDIAKVAWYGLWWLMFLYLLYAGRLMIVSNGEDDGYKKALATLKTIFIVALIIFLFLMIIYQLINDLG